MCICHSHISCLFFFSFLGFTPFSAAALVPAFICIRSCLLHSVANKSLTLLLLSLSSFLFCSVYYRRMDDGRFGFPLESRRSGPSHQEPPAATFRPREIHHGFVQQQDKHGFVVVVVLIDRCLYLAAPRASFIIWKWIGTSERARPRSTFILFECSCARRRRRRAAPGRSRNSFVFFSFSFCRCQESTRA